MANTVVVFDLGNTVVSDNSSDSHTDVPLRKAVAHDNHWTIEYW